ncbi:MAG: hypothetical protein JRG96_00320 [Deltaproteobacteria bacterium]|nr:hypothetical protein [Deltaproteobacteria bacterium]MBW2419661.1 hypothetical protein [Deltaproteobacteria bacterium]
MITQSLRYGARGCYERWGRAAGFVLGFWLALLLLLPLVIHEHPVDPTQGASSPSQVRPHD